MLIATAVAASLAALTGAHWIIVGSVIVVGAAPIPGVIVLAASAIALRWVKGRSDRDPDRETRLLRGLAAKVAAGTTLRQAISSVPDAIVTPHVRRLCAAGSSMGDVGDALGSELKVNGRRVAALCAMSELTGAPFAGALSQAADRSTSLIRSQQTKRSAVAQVRFSAWVVGVVPLILAALVVATKGIPEPGGAIIVVPMVVGVVLQVAGTIAVFILSGRAT